MSQRLERLLVVAYKYPPYSGVGAKRWAKLSKYLARKNVAVCVITVDWPGQAHEESLRDVIDPSIRIHRIPSLAPNRLEVRAPQTYLERRRMVFYRKHVRGRPLAQDAVFWGPAVIPAAAWLARVHKVQAVVVSGAPFMANYWVARGRRLLPDVPLIQEFRDPWLELPPDQLAKQGGHDRVARLERRVIRSADAIVTVTEGLSELLRAKAGSTPVYTVPNGYDPEDLPRKPSSHRRPFRLIHGGNLFVGRQAPLRCFLDVVTKLRSEMPEIELVFRGSFPPDVRADYAHLEEAGVLYVLPPIPASDFMCEIQESFVTLQFNAEHFPYLVSTKIYEYAASGKPVISVNYGGEIERLVLDHELGWSMRGDDNAGVARALRDAYSHWQKDGNMSTDIQSLEGHSHEELATDYLTLLEGLTTQRSDG